MAYLVANVESAQAWGVNPDMILVHVSVFWVSQNRSINQEGADIPVPVGAAAAEINEVVRQKAIDIAAAHGIAIGETDVVRVFGGAVPNIS